MAKAGGSHSLDSLFEFLENLPDPDKVVGVPAAPEQAAPTAASPTVHRAASAGVAAGRRRARKQSAPVRNRRLQADSEADYAGVPVSPAPPKSGLESDWDPEYPGYVPEEPPMPTRRKPPSQAASSASIVPALETRWPQVLLKEGPPLDTITRALDSQDIPSFMRVGKAPYEAGGRRLPPPPTELKEAILAGDKSLYPQLIARLNGPEFRLSGDPHLLKRKGLEVGDQQFVHQQIFCALRDNKKTDAKTASEVILAVIKPIIPACIIEPSNMVLGGQRMRQYKLSFPTQLDQQYKDYLKRRFFYAPAGNRVLCYITATFVNKQTQEIETITIHKNTISAEFNLRGGGVHFDSPKDLAKARQEAKSDVTFLLDLLSKTTEISYPEITRETWLHTLTDLVLESGLFSLQGNSSGRSLFVQSSFVDVSS